MTQIKITQKHIKRGALVIVVAAFLAWYAVPKWMYAESLNFIDDDLQRKVKQQEPYRSDGSLSFKGRQLILNHRPFRILSGAVHYFRIPPTSWRETLEKLKACGLNTVETYVPWNLHEPVPGLYDFDGVEGQLNLRNFISLAYKVGLYVILRPGPYICAEWDFGGLPSWLLKDPDMIVRSNYHGYKKAVQKYFSKLIPYVAPMQYSKGKNIIAVQIENEFGSYSDEVEHLLFLKKLLKHYGIKEMFFTSDNKHGIVKAPFYNEALPTANFGNLNTGLSIYEYIKTIDAEFPLINMEFWDGWFDHWGENHNTGMTNEELKTALERLLDVGSSVNFYMFQGGTNFGFMNGANYFSETGYQPTITSYDYGAPLTEYGKITEKYKVIKSVLKDKVPNVPVLKGPSVEEIEVVTPRRKAYGEVEIRSFLSFEHMINYAYDVAQRERPVPMEYLNLQSNHGKCGQSFGYILYRKYVPPVKKLVIQGTVNDRMQVFWNGREVAVFDYTMKHYILDFTAINVYADTNNTLDLLVENLGRVNYVNFQSHRLNEQRKGILGEVLLDGQEATDWMIYSFEFKVQYLNRIWANENYRPMISHMRPPAFYNAEFQIDDEPRDTFLSMKGWKKGVVFINDFNLGRYWDVGPQKTLYVPAAILKKNINTVRIFEQHQAGFSIKFVNKPDLG